MGVRALPVPEIPGALLGEWLAGELCIQNPKVKPKEWKTMSVVSMRQLLEAGIHFGHQTRRWNPKMKRYIYGQRNGIYIIDLAKTLRNVRHAYDVVRDSVAAGGTVLFVGCKKQAQEPIEQQAERSNMFYVSNRWLGGTLTNWETMQKGIAKLKNLEDMESSGKLDKLSKKEAARIRKELARLQRNYNGLKNMTRMPRIMFVVDTKKEALALREARRLKITTIGVVDTNSDPEQVDIAIPGNDDAIRAVNLFCRVIADAAIEGQGLASKAEHKKAQDAAGGQPLEEAMLQAAGEEAKPGAPAPGEPEAEAAAAAAPATPDAPPQGATEGGPAA